jgi:hypothetical protein
MRVEEMALTPILLPDSIPGKRIAKNLPHPPTPSPFDGEGRKKHSKALSIRREEPGCDKSNSSETL